MPLSSIREITDLQVRPLEAQRPLAARPGFPELQNGQSLNFIGVETQHATHSLHPYVAAINPPLAAALIEHYVPGNELILDPFCGGGGVLVETILLGRRALGCDINPLAVLISKAKTTPLPSNVTLQTYMALVEEADAIQRQVTGDGVPDVVRFWYHEESL